MNGRLSKSAIGKLEMKITLRCDTTEIMPVNVNTLLCKHCVL